MSAVSDLVVRLGAITAPFDKKMGLSRAQIIKTKLETLRAGKALRQMSREEYKAAERAERVAKSHAKAAANIRAATTQVMAMSAAQRRAAGFFGPTVIRSTRSIQAGMTGATAATGRFAAALGLANGNARLLVTALAPIAGPLAIVGGIAAIIRSGENFDRAMRNSLAIMGDVSTAMQQKMAQTAIETAKTVSASADEVAKAYFYLASAGMDARQSVAAMPQVAAFAQAGMFDLSTATDLATDAQSALGLKATDAQENLQNLARVTDVLVGANTLANASVEQFSAALTNKAGAALRLVNKNVEEGVAVLAALADQGLKGEEAGTALSRIMIGLKINAIQNTKAFEKLRVAVFDDTGEMRHMADIVADLERALGHLSDRQKQVAIMQLGFTKKNADLAAQLLGTSEAIREFNQALDEMGGITQEVAEKQLTPFQKGWAKLSTGFSEAGSGIMYVLGPPLQWLQTLLGETVGAVGKGVQIMRRWRTIIDSLTGGVLDLDGRLAEMTVGAEERMKKMASSIDDVASSMDKLNQTSRDTSLDEIRSKLVNFAESMGVLAPADFERYGAQVFSVREEAEKLATALNWSRITTGLYGDEVETLIRRFGDAASAFQAIRQAHEGAITPLEQYQRILRDIAEYERIGALTARQAAKERTRALEEYERISGIAEERERKKRETERKAEEVKRGREAIRARFETPAERFAREAREIDRLFRGAERTRLLGLHIKKAEEEIRRAEPKEAAAPTRMFAGAAERGSAEAWNRILTAMGGGKKQPEEETAKNTAEMMRDLKEAVSIWRAAENRGQDPMEIPS